MKAEGSEVSRRDETALNRNCPERERERAEAKKKEKEKVGETDRGRDKGNGGVRLEGREQMKGAQPIP